MFKYEYNVMVGDKCAERYSVREQARKAKAMWKADGFDVKIIQRKYSLADEREVR